MNATKDIPAGKILVAEYGELTTADFAEETILETAFSPRLKTEAALMFISPGFKAAGSRAIWTNGGFAVLWMGYRPDGGTGLARTGQHYTTEADARAHFAKLMLAHDAKTTPTFNGDEQCASCFCGWWMKGGADAMATMAKDHNAMAGA